MKKRTKVPIESFGPELMAALLHGSTKEFRFPLPFRDAVKFRRRIHMLRTRMREEDHPQRQLVERARVSIVWGKEAGQPEPELRRTDNSNRVPVDLDTPCVVVIKPYDVEFQAALTAAGVDIKVDVGTDLHLPSGEREVDDPLASFNPSRTEE